MPEYRASDGVRIHYRERGDGPPVVFIHGWMMSGRFFERQLAGLANQFRCVALDLRGCGESQARAGTHTLDRFADDVHDFLTARGWSDVVLVGWSLGGGITMRYIDRHGVGRLRGVALVDFPPKYEEDAAVTEKVIHKLRTDRDRYMANFVRRMFLREPSQEDLAWMLSENSKCATETGVEMYRQLGVGSVIGQRLELPALLAFPDQGWFPGALDAWRPIFPHAKVPPFPESRHCPFLEEPAGFNAALLNLAVATNPA